MHIRKRILNFFLFYIWQFGYIYYSDPNITTESGISKFRKAMLTFPEWWEKLEDIPSYGYLVPVKL